MYSDMVILLTTVQELATPVSLRFKSYGEHSDAELLRTYGFVTWPWTFRLAKISRSLSPGGAGQSQSQQCVGGYPAGAARSVPSKFQQRSGAFGESATPAETDDSWHSDQRYSWYSKRIGQEFSKWLGHLVVFMVLKCSKSLSCRFAIPASGVLPAELLTVVQVLLMSQWPGSDQLESNWSTTLWFGNVSNTNFHWIWGQITKSSTARIYKCCSEPCGILTLSCCGFLGIKHHVHFWQLLSMPGYTFYIFLLQ